MTKFNSIIDFIRKAFKTEDFIPLHSPIFEGNEKKYLNACIDSTYVSSVGDYVNDFEIELSNFTGIKFAVLCDNGTNALHLSLKLAGVSQNDEVLTQSLTFVATANAITYAGATPCFIDVDIDTMGLSPQALKDFLEEKVIIKNGVSYNKSTNRRIKACLPMHTFGHACRIDEIASICKRYNIELVEDAAEAMGSLYLDKHLGNTGLVSVVSFNGNKIMTSGGGGVILTNNEDIAIKARHLSTQAKLMHPWEYEHDEIGYNYRMPNLNAALGLAQLEQLSFFIEKKRQLANSYNDFFKSIDYNFFNERDNERSNYWLNAIIFDKKIERDEFLALSNKNGLMTRPLWKPLHLLPMFNNCQSDGLKNSKWLYDRVVCLPSSATNKQ